MSLYLNGVAAQLTELVPQLPALVRHRRALRLPQDEPRVRQKLIRHEREHASAVRVPHAKHFPNLKKCQKAVDGLGLRGIGFVSAGGGAE